MATFTMRNGNNVATFTNNTDGTVTIEDNGDNMPYTVSTVEGRVEWARYINMGYTRDKATVSATPVVATSAPVTVPVSRTGDRTQTERDVNRTMGSSRSGLARQTWDNGTNGAESKAKDMQRVIESLKSGGGLFIVNYYIPVELSRLTVEVPSQRTGRTVTRLAVPNPAADWRGIAIHLDGSNWLMTGESLKSDEVQDFFGRMDNYKDFMGGAGETPAYWDTQLRDEEHVKFLAIAERKFMQYVRNLHGSLIECIASADDALRTAMESPEWATMDEKAQQKEENYRNNRIRSRIKKADQELTDAIKCAESFDMAENLEDLFSALRNAISSQRSSFNATAESKGIKVA